MKNLILTIFITFSSLLFGEKFSWLNEENIIQELLYDSKIQSNINKFYVDLGAGDGISMSNTAKLAFSGWKGVAVEYDASSRAKFLSVYRPFLKNVAFDQSKITPSNVVTLLQKHNVPKNFGVLSLDIDGYDYFVLEALLSEYRPTIIISEINEKIPPPLEFTVLYSDDYVWDTTHFYGQSLSQLKKLASSKGYSLIHLEGNNAFLICQECCSKKNLSAQEAYAGYVYFKDRTLYFPWNKNLDHLINGTPKENFDFLSNLFKKHHGKYILKIGE